VTGKVFPVVRNLIGIGFFLMALYLSTIGVQSYIDLRLNTAEITGLGEKNSNKIVWITYDETSFSKLSKELKPVMLDFYADWCIPCKELDRFTFSAAEVIELSKKFVMIKVDLTKSNNPESIILKEKFDIKGVPTLVFLSPGGKEIPGTRVVGFMEKDPFLLVMEKAIQASK
jgi:thiol:disulfide interchange protein DsbD